MLLLVAALALTMILFALLALPALGEDNEPEAAAASSSPLAEHLEDRAEAREIVEAAFRDRRRTVWKALERFYERRDHEPAWIDQRGRSRPAAEELLQALRQAGDHGLEPGDYEIDLLAEQLRRVADGEATVAERWDIDLELTAAFLTHALHMLNGRVDPDDVDRRWYVEPRRRDLAAVLEDALEEQGVAAALESLAPPHKPYEELREALARYRELAAGGGWPEVPEGDVLEEGDVVEPERYAALVERLMTEEDLDTDTADVLTREAVENLEAPEGGPEAESARAGEAADEEAGPAGPVYDERLAEAVRRFQRRNGIEVDGLVGPQTVSTMNVSAEERVHRIELNLERWRWLPADLGRRHVRVNIADQTVVGVEDGEEVLSMRVVVGKESTKTPVFSDVMTYVVINPYWNVPRSIAQGELLPKGEAYLARNNFEIVDGGRLRQRPGPGNALGRIKFMFPNRFNIYLHDTPADHLFARAERDFSHGCVRLERPVDFAGFVFAEDPDWTAERVQRAIDSAEHQRVELDEDIPVYLLYWTAFVKDGKVHFEQDFYGHDRALEEALAQRRRRLKS